MQFCRLVLIKIVISDRADRGEKSNILRHYDRTTRTNCGELFSVACIRELHLYLYIEITDGLAPERNKWIFTENRI